MVKLVGEQNSRLYSTSVPTGPSMYRGVHRITVKYLARRLGTLQLKASHPLTPTLKLIVHEITQSNVVVFKSSQDTLHITYSGTMLCSTNPQGTSLLACDISFPI